MNLNYTNAVKNYRRASIWALLLLLALTSQTRGLAQDSPRLLTQSNPANGSWLNNAMNDIGLSPYSIKSSQKGTYLASNRNQNLEFEICPNGYLINESQFSLTFSGLYADGINVFLPEETTSELNHDRLVYHQGILSIEYVHSPDGLRQNFIVNDPGYPAEKLSVVQLLKGGTIQSSSTDGLVFDLDKKGAKDIYYYSLKAWDANRNPLDACFVQQSSNQFALQVDVSNAVFPVTIDPLSGTKFSAFQSHDWSTESDQDYSSYGVSVANAGDVNNDGYDDVVVGAYYYTNGQTEEGVAFVYYGSSLGLSTAAGDTLELDQDYAGFGYSVASAGDINGDGFDDIVVGAVEYSNVQTLEGGAFIFYGNSTDLTRLPNDTLEIDQIFAEFGVCVSGAGDVDNDGYDDLIIGAHYYENGQIEEGAAFVYYGSSGGINTTAGDTIESNQDYAYMGFSVASAGDVNGDGYDDVIIGAEEYDNGQSNEGRAFLYHGSVTGLSSTANWTSEPNQDSASYGICVSSAGDVNGDGYDDVIVGADLYDNGELDEGAVFVHYGSSLGLSTTANWTMESNQDDCELGWPATSAGDVNGDGYDDVLVAATYYSNGQLYEGKAFAFYGSASGLGNSHAWTVESNQSNIGFAGSASSAGDVNGDGYDDVIIGAEYFENGQTEEGGAFVYHGGFTNISSPTIRPLSVSSGFTRDTANFYEHEDGWDYYYKVNGADTIIIAAFRNNGYVNHFDIVSMISHDDNWHASLNDTGVSVVRRFLEVYSNGVLMSGAGGVDVRVFVDQNDTSAAASKLPVAQDKYEWFKLSRLFSSSDIAYDSIKDQSDSSVLVPFGTGSYKGINYVQFNGITSFSTFGSVVSSNIVGPSALPVSILSFTAKYDQDRDNVDLEWKTAEEINNKSFRIQRSFDGNSWQEIAEIPGAGNSSEVLTYQAIDRNPLRGVSFYRLTQTDIDGSEGRPLITKIRITAFEPKDFVISPNPVKDVVHLSLADSEESVVFEIYDINGALMKQGSFSSTAVIDVSDFRKGLYYLHVTGSEHSNLYKSEAFVKQ